MSLPSKKIAQIMVEKISKASSHEEKIEISKAFATILHKEGITSKFQNIANYFTKIWNQKHKEIDVLVETATEHHPHIPKHIGEHTLNVSYKHNPDLIAGINIEIDDYVVSNNLKKDLSQLKAL